MPIWTGWPTCWRRAFPVRAGPIGRRASPAGSRLPVIDGVPRYGYVLDNGFDIVGVILLISSRRGGQIISNLSSWYVEPQWRTHSTLLISLATKLKHVTYLNASPAPHTWRPCRRRGSSRTISAAAPSSLCPAAARVSDVIPDDLPEARLLRDHRAMGMTSLVVESDGIVSPFVLQAAQAGQAARAGDGRDVHAAGRTIFGAARRHWPSISCRAAAWAF